MKSGGNVKLLFLSLIFTAMIFLPTPSEIFLKILGKEFLDIRSRNMGIKEGGDCFESNDPVLCSWGTSPKEFESVLMDFIPFNFISVFLMI